MWVRDLEGRVDTLLEMDSILIEPISKIMASINGCIPSETYKARETIDSSGDER